MTVDPDIRQTLGVSLAVGSAFSYAATNVLVRRGARRGLLDHGLLLTLAVNIVILVPVSLIAGIQWEGPNPAAGFAWYAASGLLAGFMGRIALFGGIVRIGSSRASSLKNAAPMVAVAMGVLVLHEQLDVQSWLGIALCLSGLGLLVRNRQPIAPIPAGVQPSTIGIADESALAVEAGEPRWMTSRPSTRVIGTACGLGAALFFGLSQSARKLGTTDLPDPLFGALVAVTVSAFAYVGYLAAHRRLWEVVRANVLYANANLFGAGVMSAAGMLTFLLALTMLSVSVASVIASAEVLFTVVLAALVLRRTEMVTVQVVFAAVLVCVGAVVLSSS